MIVKYIEARQHEMRRGGRYIIARGARGGGMAGMGTGTARRPPQGWGDERWRRLRLGVDGGEREGRPGRGWEAWRRLRHLG